MKEESLRSPHKLTKIAFRSRFRLRIIARILFLLAALLWPSLACAEDKFEVALKDGRRFPVSSLSISKGRINVVSNSATLALPLENVVSVSPLPETESPEVQALKSEKAKLERELAESSERERLLGEQLKKSVESVQETSATLEMCKAEALRVRDEMAVFREKYDGQVSKARHALEGQERGEVQVKALQSEKSELLKEVARLQNLLKGTCSVGETGKIGKLAYSVTSIDRKKEIREGFSVYRADGMFLVLKVVVENVGKKPIGHPDVDLIDDEGREYTRSLLGFSSLQWTQLSSLNPGVEEKGTLVFDVPSGRHYLLRLTGNFLTDAPEAFVDLASR